MSNDAQTAWICARSGAVGLSDQPRLGTDDPAPASTTEAVDSLEELKNEADAAYRQQQYPRAIELTTSVLSKSPEDHVALYLRASARVESGARKRMSN